jgi:hypothetical protein
MYIFFGFAFVFSDSLVCFGQKYCTFGFKPCVFDLRRLGQKTAFEINIGI